MKKAIIEVKRLNSNDTIATSAKVCKVDLSKCDALFESDGTWNNAYGGPGTKNGYWFYYENGSFRKVETAGVPASYFDSTPTMKDGKWYHEYGGNWDTKGAYLVECPNPESHNLPE